MYQGDELGLRDGPGAYPPFDRAGRDGARHPMQWNGSESGGFTTGVPWLPPVDPGHLNVESAKGDPSSLLSLYRRLLALRRTFAEGFEILGAEDDVLVYRRGEHAVTLNFGERETTARGNVVLHTHDGGSKVVPPHGAAVSRVR